MNALSPNNGKNAGN